MVVTALPKLNRRGHRRHTFQWESQRIYGYRKSAMSAYYVPGTILGAGDKTVNKIHKNPCFHGRGDYNQNIHLIKHRISRCYEEE